MGGLPWGLSESLYVIHKTGWDFQEALSYPVVSLLVSHLRMRKECAIVQRIYQINCIVCDWVLEMISHSTFWRDDKAMSGIAT